MNTGAAGSLSAVLDWASRDVRRILVGVLDGGELSVDHGIALTGADGRDYIDLTRAIKGALPGLHLHAFSPEEVLYGSVRSGLPIREYLTELRAAGLGTLPGTSAEILDQEIRDRISRGRITVDQWVEVITTAHALGIRTTSTIMYGHVETPAHWIRHMALLRSIQKDTGGFTEFVPLSLIHSE